MLALVPLVMHVFVGVVHHGFCSTRSAILPIRSSSRFVQIVLFKSSRGLSSNFHYRWITSRRSHVQPLLLVTTTVCCTGILQKMRDPIRGRMWVHILAAFFYSVWIFECHSRLIRSCCRRGAVWVNFPNVCGSSCLDLNVQSTSLNKDVYHTRILI